MAQDAPTQRAGAAQHAAQAGKAHQPAKSGASRTVGAAGIRRALVAAFPYTVPIMAGFVFLGLACGIYSHSLGLPAWCPRSCASSSSRDPPSSWWRPCSRAPSTRCRCSSRPSWSTRATFLRHLHAGALSRLGAQALLPHLRHVRRDLLDQLRHASARRRRPRLVHVFHHHSEPAVLGGGLHAGRRVRNAAQRGRQRPELCHDGAVRGDLLGPVAQRAHTRELAGRRGAFACGAAGVRAGQLHHPSYGVAILVACLALRQRLEPVVGLAGEEGASAAPSGPAGEDDSAAREADAR